MEQSFDTPPCYVHKRFVLVVQLAHCQWLALVSYLLSFILIISLSWKIFVKDICLLVQVIWMMTFFFFFFLNKAESYILIYSVVVVFLTVHLMHSFCSTLLHAVVFSLCSPCFVPFQAVTGSSSVPATWQQMVTLQAGGSCSASWESGTASSSAKRDRRSLPKTWWAKRPSSAVLRWQPIELGKKKKSNAVIFKNRPGSPMSPRVV